MSHANQNKSRTVFRNIASIEPSQPDPLLAVTLITTQYNAEIVRYSVV
jgi:hypothetical protein